MIFRSLVLSTFISLAVSQDGCSICGDGKGVNEPDAIFEFPGQPSVPCGLLQTAGETGQIPIEQCPFLAPFLSMCECIPLSDIVNPTLAPVDPTPAPVAPTPAPTPAPTQAPTRNPTPLPTIEPTMVATPAPVPASDTSTPAICTSIPTDGCSVCGEGEYVSIADGIFEFPGQPAVPCSILETAGETGQIPLSECVFLPSLVSITCGCTECPDSNAIPQVTPVPTSSPTAAPTSPPTRNPTVAPTPVPTSQPTLPPTNQPTPSPTSSPTPEPAPVAPTPFPVIVFTPAPVEMADDDETGDDADMGGKKAKKTKQQTDKGEKSTKRGDRAGRRLI